MGGYPPASLWMWMSVLCLAYCGSTKAGDAPVFEFDVARIVACQDATTEAYRQKHQESFLIEAVIEISPRLVSGKEPDLKELLIEIKSPDERLPLRKYLPNSVLTSDVVGGVIRIEQTETNGLFTLDYSVTSQVGQAKIELNGMQSHASLSKLAPKSLLVASGTTDRSHGVYYKLMPSPRDTVQKTYQFTCLFEVPRSFRSDYLQIDCRATGIKRGLIGYLDSEVICGSAGFVVGLYLNGDEQAKDAAEKISKCQQDLFDEIIRHRQELVKQAEGDGIWSKIFTVFSWLLTQRNLSVGASAPLFSPQLISGLKQGRMSEQSLPGEVAQRIKELEAAKSYARSLMTP